MTATTDLFSRVPKWRRGLLFGGFFDKSGCEVHIPLGFLPSNEEAEALMDEYIEFFANQPEPYIPPKTIC